MKSGFYYTNAKVGETIVFVTDGVYLVIVAEDYDFKNSHIFKVDANFEDRIKKYDAQSLEDNEQFHQALREAYPSFHRDMIKTIL